MKRSCRLLALLLFAWPVVAGGQGGPAPDADLRIEKLVASVSVDHLRQMLTTLAGFGTRNTLSDTTSSTRGIGAARQWIFDELQRSSPKLQVSFDTYRVAPQGRITQEVEIRNVMAVLPGRSSRRIYVTGHYDSLNIPDQTRSIKRPAPLPAGFDAMAQPGQDFNVDAAGANDDGSGTVLTLELARRFAESGIDFDATLVFICWAGEEQGLIGSTAHAQRLAGEQATVEAMFDSDIVGNSRGGNGIVDGASVRVYADGPEDSMSRSLARYIQKLSALYVPSHRIRLFARQDRFGRGSDHQAFNGFGFPAVVFREANENYARQHSANDTLDGVDFEYLAQNTRVNTAAVASLALAPPAPGVLSDRGQPLLGRDPSGYDANLRWVASTGAVAYRIYWRDGWAADWQHQQLVGNVTQFVLPKLSIDNVVIGVAAVGPAGHESLVSAYVSPPRRVQDVTLAGNSAPQSAIPGVISAGARVETVRGGFKGLEGPVAASDGGLYFSDIPTNRTYKLAPDGTISVWREGTNGANGLFLLKDGRLLAAESTGPRIVSVAPDGQVMPLATAFSGRPFRAPNDLIPDAKGGVYFTDPAPRPSPDVAPKESGNVHYLRPNGAVLLLDAQIRRPNGITLSLDEKTLYVGDTEGDAVFAFDVRADGSVANKREFAKLIELEKGSLGLRSRADGMALDSMGRLYVATAAGIQVIDSRGRHLGIIRVPSVARNLAFAGPRRQVLYLTALESLYRVQMLSAGPPARAK